LNIVINLRKKQLDGLVIYKYSVATSTQASSTSTSTQLSSTSTTPSNTSTSTSNLYSSTTQVQVPSTTFLLYRLIYFAVFLLVYLWWPYVIGQAIYIFILSFVLLSFFFFLSSLNLSGRRLDVCHAFTHGVALVRI